MLQKITSVILLIAFAAHLFSSELIVLEYYTNTSAFAKNCVNKAKPMMHCNGKCQMMKKMTEAQKKDEQAPERSYGNLDLTLPLSAFKTNDRVFNDIAVTSKIGYLQPYLPRGISFDIFHPPSLV